MRFWGLRAAVVFSTHVKTRLPRVPIGRAQETGLLTGRNSRQSATGTVTGSK